MQSLKFGPLEVSYDDRVLVPRPWTIVQAEWAAELAVTSPRGAILELCAGVGHIGQAAAVLSGRDLVQVDADPHACGIARVNVAANNLDGRVDVRCADINDGPRPDERFAIVLADPPYLESEDVAEWPDDPPMAVDGGASGIELQRRCVAIAATHLLEGGVVLMQARGTAQVDLLAEDLHRHGLRVVTVRAPDEQRAVARLERA